MAHPYTRDHECEPFQINKSLFAFHPGHRSSSCCSLCLRQIYANLPDASVFVSFFSLLLFLQIHIDIPRTNPLIPLFQQASVQEVRLPYSTTPPSPPTHSPPISPHTPPQPAGFFPCSARQIQTVALTVGLNHN